MNGRPYLLYSEIRPSWIPFGSFRPRDPRMVVVWADNNGDVRMFAGGTRPTCPLRPPQMSDSGYAVDTKRSPCERLQLHLPAAGSWTISTSCGGRFHGEIPS